MAADHSIKMEKITMGVCYYPEHWDRSLWSDDLQRMLAAGIEVIRIAEFAWNKFEPEEGIFTFDFFDRFMEVVEHTPMKVIFCTPTATPPAWASHNYPEILNARKDGMLYRHGLRQHYNYNSAKYRVLSQNIVEQLAVHYSKHPSIIGWQIDNEFNCENDEFYSESDHAAFRVFLRKRYKTIEALNEAWGTIFWNQSYNSWEQVYAPRMTSTGGTNPHQQLDYYRFISDSACTFAGIQTKILRRYLPQNVFITTNGLFSNIDYNRMTRESLDFITYDSYPNFSYSLDRDPKHSDDLNDRKWSRDLSETRAISPIFGIMEQQSGANGWCDCMESPAPKPGQATLWTMQSIAHGADYISYFRWRTCTVGTEIYWHGILDYDNRDNRRLREIQSIAQRLKALKEIAGARFKASFAVIEEYDNIWDAQYDRWHSRVEKTSRAGWFRASQLCHTPMDYLYLNETTSIDEMTRYPLLVYPHATILSEHTASLLKQYAAQGGILVMGCRTGYKDINGHCIMLPKPGLVYDLCGVDIEDCTFVGPGDEKSILKWDEEEIEAVVFNDILSPLPDAEILAYYATNYYEGRPALIRRRFGDGWAYYFGGAFNQKTASAFLKKLGVAEPHQQLLTLPEECELTVREKGDYSYLFVLNYADHDVKLEVKQEMKELFSGEVYYGKLSLEPYGVRVFQTERLD